MIPPGAATRLFLGAGPTDMRRGFDGLADLVRHQLIADPLSGHWFAFCNKRHNRVKMLYSDGSGLIVPLFEEIRKGQPSVGPMLDRQRLSLCHVKS